MSTANGARKAAATFAATTYPENSKLLERELDKLLNDPHRKANIRTVERLIETHLPEPASTSKRAKTPHK